jgi:O-antigen ligase
VQDPNNPSNQSRILEDMGLIVTLQQHPIGGSGFGHQYVEISDTFSVKYVFPQYRYVPHNSVLGLLAFTGFLGFAVIWMVFPVTAYMAARTYAFAKTPLVRTIAMCATCEVIIHTNQLWGDIGLNANQGLVVVSAAVAAACRLPIEAGAWPAKRGRQNRSGNVETVTMRVTMAEESTDAPGAASS